MWLCVCMDCVCVWVKRAAHRHTHTLSGEKTVFSFKSIMSIFSIDMIYLVQHLFLRTVVTNNGTFKQNIQTLSCVSVGVQLLCGSIKGRVQHIVMQIIPLVSVCQCVSVWAVNQCLRLMCSCLEPFEIVKLCIWSWETCTVHSSLCDSPDPRTTGSWKRLTDSRGCKDDGKWSRPWVDGSSQIQQQLWSECRRQVDWQHTAPSPHIYTFSLSSMRRHYLFTEITTVMTNSLTFYQTLASVLTWWVKVLHVLSSSSGSMQLLIWVSLTHSHH